MLEQDRCPSRRIFSVIPAWILIHSVPGVLQTARAIMACNAAFGKRVQTFITAAGLYSRETHVHSEQLFSKTPTASELLPSLQPFINSVDRFALCNWARLLCRLLTLQIKENKQWSAEWLNSHKLMKIQGVWWTQFDHRIWEIIHIWSTNAQLYMWNVFFKVFFCCCFFTLSPYEESLLTENVLRTFSWHSDKVLSVLR